MKKWILAIWSLIKSILPQEKPVQKRVLEKVVIVRPMKKKHYSASKKQGKKKCQK